MLPPNFTIMTGFFFICSPSRKILLRQKRRGCGQGRIRTHPAKITFGTMLHVGSETFLFNLLRDLFGVGDRLCELLLRPFRAHLFVMREEIVAEYFRLEAERFFAGI